MNNIKIGGLLSYVNVILSIAISVVVTPLILKAFGEREYGVYQMAVSLIGYMSVLEFGLHNVTTRFVAKYNAKNEVEEKESFLAINMIVFTLIAVLIIVVGGFVYCNIEHFFSLSMTKKELILTKKLFAILVINLAISMPGAVFDSVVFAYERFVFSKLLVTMKLLLRLLIVFFILKIGFKSMGLICIDFFLNNAVIVVNMVYCFKVLKIKIKLHKFSWSLIKIIFSFSVFGFIASITEQINWKLDTIIIGSAIGVAEVAKYSIASQLIACFRSFSVALSSIFLPRATKMVALGKDGEELTELMIQVGRVQLIISGLVFGGFVLVGKEFISLWVGEEYCQAYYWFIVIAATLIIPITQGVGVSILEAKFMHKFRAIIYLLIAILNMLLTVILVNRLGVNGAVIGTSVAVFIGNNVAINWYYYKKVHLNIPKFIYQVHIKLIPIQIMLFSIGKIMIHLIKMNGNSWIELLVKIFIICIIYVIGVYLLGLNPSEKLMAKKYIKK